MASEGICPVPPESRGSYGRNFHDGDRQYWRVRVATCRLRREHDLCRPSTVTNTVTVGPTVTETVTYTPPPPPGPKTTIDTDGTYAVGTDIVQGVYRTTGLGTDGEPDCYWARLRSLDTWDIINNNNSPGPQIVEIQPSDKAFLTQNCAPWLKSG
jgi:hypothetical protein